MRYFENIHVSLEEEFMKGEHAEHMMGVIVYFFLHRSVTVDDFEKCFVNGDGEGVDYVELRIFTVESKIDKYLDEDCGVNYLPSEVYPAGTAIAITFSDSDEVPPYFSIFKRDEYLRIVSDVLKKVVEVNLLREERDIKDLKQLISRIRIS